MHAYAIVQQPCCHGNYHYILSWVLCKHREGCWLPHAHLLSQCTRLDDCSLKKTIQTYTSSWRGRDCVVAQASPDHPYWCRPHPAGLCFALTIGRGAHSRQRFVFAIDLADFLSNPFHARQDVFGSSVCRWMWRVECSKQYIQVWGFSFLISASIWGY